MDDVRAQFEELCNNIIVKTTDDACSIEDCLALKQVMESGKLASLVEAMFTSGEFNEDAIGVLFDTFSSLADKLHSLEAFEEEFQVLEKAAEYFDADTDPRFKIIEEKVGIAVRAKKEKAERVRAEREAAAQEQEARERAAREKAAEEERLAAETEAAKLRLEQEREKLEQARRQNEAQNEPAAVEEGNQAGGGINKLIMIGAAAAVIIGAALVMFTGGEPKQSASNGVTAKTDKTASSAKAYVVNFTVPEGTTIKVDGKEVGTSLKLSEGSHKLDLEHPLLALKFDANFNVSADKKLAPVTEARLRADRKDAVGQRYVATLNDIFQQAAVGEKAKLDAARYNVNDKALQASMDANVQEVHNFMQKRNINSMVAEKAVITEGSLAIINKNGEYQVGGKLTIESKADSKNFKLPLDAKLSIKGDKLQVAEVKTFHFKK